MNFITQIREKRKRKKEDKKKVKEVKDSHDVFIERPKLNFLVKLWYIFIKNMNLLIRSKTSALIFFFGPLLIVLLVTLAFNTSTLYDLNIAVYSGSISPLTETIIGNLEDNQYNVIVFSKFEECIDAVKFSDFHVCTVFPKDMQVDNSQTNIIEIYVDNSRLNIANLIAGQISTKVSIEASALSEELVGSILTTIDNTNTGIVFAIEEVNDLEASNSGHKSSVSNLESNLGSVDFSYSEFDSSSISEEIDSIKKAQNLSSSIFTDLKEMVDDYDSAYEAIAGKIDSASNKLEEITFTSLSSDLSDDSASLNELELSLVGMNQEIEDIAITDVGSIVNPVKTNISPISSTSSYLFYILPTVLILLIMFVALMVASTNIISEKTSRAFFRNFITPTSDLLLLVGAYISNLFVLFLQVLAMMGFLYYMFPEMGYHVFLVAGACLLLVGTLFIFLGMLLGYLFNTKESVILAALSSAITLLFFSNTILPLETLSSYSRQMVQYNPFIIGESVLKNLFLFGSGFEAVSLQFYILSGLSLALLIGTIMAQKLSKKYLTTA
jgi:ABC-type multidrug transport system permease subunit